MYRLIAAFIMLTLSMSQLHAQADRYELGRRLVRFEQQWELTKDPAARQKSLALLPKVTTQFFSLQLGEAGRTLDEARWALLGKEPNDAERWAESFFVMPPAVLHDLSKEDFTCRVAQFYPPKVAQPADATLTLTFGDTTVPVPTTKFPAKVILLAKGATIDRTARLKLEVKIKNDVLAMMSIETRVVADLAETIKQLHLLQVNNALSETIEHKTLKDRFDLLETLSRGDIPESDRHIDSILAEIKKLSVLPGTQRVYESSRAGDYSLTLPLPQKQAATVRLFVPKGLDATKPVPLVVAMHGAGGSENMFFESYGAGQIVRECEKRGWILVCTRGGFLGSPPVPAIITALQERYAIDKNAIFIVGHSMGAGQAAELAQQNPTLFRGVALLGGAARVRDVPAFAKLPLFIGVGTKDQLAYKSSLALIKTLKDAKAMNLIAKEYPEVEHLVIVREALPDLFDSWQLSLMNNN